MVGKRLSQQDRRAQLLDTAAAIVRAEGADALTLARVAEVAGVSKPIAYDHFETRAGLLTALYRRLDDQQMAAAQQALEAQAGTLAEAARVLAGAYVDCVLHIGREYGSVTAALATFPEADEFLRAGRERYAQVYRQALERFASAPAGDAGDALMLGVVGAAEALAREVSAGRLPRTAAVEAIGRILLGAVKTPAPAA